MITEDYVSFETAKLLKEKGFVVPYDSFRGVYINGEFLRRNPGQGYFFNIGDEIIEVCSIQMAMKWLREVHHLVIQIEFIDFLEHGEVWLYSIIERKTIKQLTGRDEDFTEHSYEEACEAAIRYCLENLI